jgi:hypothetical protein
MQPIDPRRSSPHFCFTECSRIRLTLGQQMTKKWRRERDSNPRCPARGTADFESAAFDLSAISPQPLPTTTHHVFPFICIRISARVQEEETASASSRRPTRTLECRRAYTSHSNLDTPPGMAGELSIHRPSALTPVHLIPRGMLIAVSETLPTQWVWMFTESPLRVFHGKKPGPSRHILLRERLR